MLHKAVTKLSKKFLILLSKTVGISDRPPNHEPTMPPKLPRAKKETPHIPKELSWLSFNERVLQEAADPSVPAIQRVRYLGIFSNNMDEFFRVRVADVPPAGNILKPPPSRTTTKNC